MRFVFFIFLLAIALSLGFFLTRGSPSRKTHTFIETITARIAPSPTSTVTPTPTPDLAPQLIIIPKLEIITQVEHVGTAPSGAMDVPKNAWQVGWYRGSTRPGAHGNAVISGHY